MAVTNQLHASAVLHLGSNTDREGDKRKRKRAKSPPQKIFPPCKQSETAYIIREFNNYLVINESVKEILLWYVLCVCGLQGDESSLTISSVTFKST